ncbi:hypothetical protein NYE59_23355 [Paenibacillus sp. FSL L8-0323]|uniref:hypothetical protein n=1 Tax=Paenibacillus sp. FSL L8-0323 TaxID=2975330 RepID=UPI0030F9CB47
MSKKILSIILVSLALTACGNNTESGAGEATQSPSAQATEKPPEITAAPTEAPVVEETEDVVAETPQKQIDEQHLFAEFINYITPTLTEQQGVMDQSSYDVIVKNYMLFPATEKTKVNSLIDKSVTTKHLNKSLSSYLNKFVEISGDVIEIEENETDIGMTAIIHINDENGNSVMGVYPGKSGDIFEGDSATITGVPIANFSFENVSGGYTNATLLATSTITKN